MSWTSSEPNPLPPNVDIHWILDSTGWIGTGLATILVAARLFTRYHLLHTANWNDVIMGLSAILGIVATSLQTAASFYGAGKHVWYLTQAQVEKASLLGTIAVPFMQMTVALPKIAAAAVLLRIAGPTAGRKIKIYFYSLTGLLVVLSMLYCLFIFVQCRPVFALWTDAHDAVCWNPMIVAIVGTVTCVVSVWIDLSLAVYPIFIIRRLQMSLRKKITICTMMSLGTSATICAGFKIAHLRDQTKADVTYDVIELSSWSLAEMNLILISACIPMLRPLWLYLRGKPVTASSDKSGAGPHSSAAGGGNTGRAAGGGAGRPSRRGFAIFGNRHDGAAELDCEAGHGGRGTANHTAQEMTVDFVLQELPGENKRDPDHEYYRGTGSSSSSNEYSNSHTAVGAAATGTPQLVPQPPSYNAFPTRDSSRSIKVEKTVVVTRERR